MGRLRSLGHQLHKADWAKPFRNVGVLLLGRGTQALFSLVYVALAARALGPRDFGILILIHSLALAVGEIAKFQSWQVVLHYGSEPLLKGDIGGLRRVLNFSLLLDTIGATIGLVVIYFGASNATALFDIPPEMQMVTRLYGISIIFMIFGDTPSGLLRLLGRFDLLSWQNAAMPVVRLIGSIYLYLIHSDVVGFLALWFAGTVFENLVLFTLGFVEGKRRGIYWRSAEAKSRDRAGGSLFAPTPGIWRFSIYTSLNGSLQLAQTHLGTLVTGSLLGPINAGLFRIGSQVASVLVKPLRQLFMPAILPELSHLKAAGDETARRLMVRRVSHLTGLAALALLILLILIGRPAIAMFAGPDYVDAYGVMVVLAAGGAVAAWAVALEPLLISDGHVRFITAVRANATLLYLIALYWLTRHMGLIGAGFAALFQTSIISLVFLLRVSVFKPR
jgi:O-antigen/teichoic acid export membrane protein